LQPFLLRPNEGTEDQQLGGKGAAVAELDELRVEVENQERVEEKHREEEEEEEEEKEEEEEEEKVTQKAMHLILAWFRGVGQGGAEAVRPGTVARLWTRQPLIQSPG